MLSASKLHVLLTALFLLVCCFGTQVCKAQDDPFRKWLHNLTIHVPGEWFPVDGNNLTLTDFECHSIDFKDVTSSLDLPLKYQLGLNGLTIACGGNWIYYSPAHPHLLHPHGHVAVTVGPSSLDMEILLSQDSYGLANGASMPVCNINLNIADVKCSGSVVSDVVNIFFQAKFFREFIAKAISGAISGALSKVVTGPLSHMLNATDMHLRKYLNTTPDTPPAVPADAMDLTNNSIVKALNRLMDSRIGYHGINRLFDYLTNNTGMFQKHNMTHLVAPTVHIPSLGDVSFGVSDFVLFGLDSWNDFDFFNPMNNHTLGTHTSMRELGLNVTFFVNVSVSGDMHGIDLYEKAQFTMRLTNNALSVQTQLALSSNIYHALQGSQFLKVPCLCDVIEDVNFTQFALNTTVADIELVALGGAFEKDLDDAIDNLLALFTRSFGPAIPTFLNGYLTIAVREMVNTKISSFIANTTAGSTCPPPDGAEQVESIAVVIPFTGCFVAFAVFAAIAVYCARRRRLPFCGGFFAQPYVDIKTPSGGDLNSSEGDYGATTSSGRTRNRFADTVNENQPLLSSNTSPSPSPSLNLSGSANTCETQPPLFIHPGISLVVRMGLILVIWLNIALFIFSNNSEGAGVYLELTLDAKPIRLPYLFQFTLANSVRDMWRAGVYPLSLLIAVFSGGWPYAKLLLMLMCWCTPVTFLSLRKREIWLMVVDALGKWSLIDSYVMVMMLVAFRFHLAVPGTPHTSADVFVEPGVGIYTFVAATMLSLILSHLCLHFHRKVQPEHRVLDQPLTGGRTDEPEALRSHHFRCNHIYARCTKLGQIVLPLAVLLAAAFLGAGAAIDSFAFVFKGAAALVLKATGGDPSTSYSLISLATSMPYSSTNPDDFGVRFLQSCFLMFALVFPIAHLLSILILWLIPLTLKAQYRVYVMVECFNAWAAIDVFVIVIIACLLEVQQFAQFIVGDGCDQVNVFLAEYLAPYLDGDNVCFDVVTTLNRGCWVLFSAAVVALICNFIVMRTCRSALAERMAVARRDCSLDLMNDGDGSDSDKSRNKCCSPCTSISLLCFTLNCVEPEHSV